VKDIGDHIHTIRCDDLACRCLVNVACDVLQDRDRSWVKSPHGRVRLREKSGDLPDLLFLAERCDGTGVTFVTTIATFAAVVGKCTAASDWNNDLADAIEVEEGWDGPLIDCRTYEGALAGGCTDGCVED